MLSSLKVELLLNLYKNVPQFLAYPVFLFLTLNKRFFANISFCQMLSGSRRIVCLPVFCVDNERCEKLIKRVRITENPTARH